VVLYLQSTMLGMLLISTYNFLITILYDYFFIFFLRKFYMIILIVSKMILDYFVFHYGRDIVLSIVRFVSMTEIWLEWLSHSLHYSSVETWQGDNWSRLRSVVVSLRKTMLWYESRDSWTRCNTINH
jgi:hypothetical protein